MSSCSYSWYKTCLAKQCLHETKSLCSDSEIEFQNLKTFHLTAIISVFRSQMTPYSYWNFRQWKTKLWEKCSFSAFFAPCPPITMLKSQWRANASQLSCRDYNIEMGGEGGMDNGLNSHNILSLIVWNSQIHQENHTSQLVTQCWAL